MSRLARYWRRYVYAKQIIRAQSAWRQARRRIKNTLPITGELVNVGWLQFRFAPYSRPSRAVYYVKNAWTRVYIRGRVWKIRSRVAKLVSFSLCALSSRSREPVHRVDWKIAFEASAQSEIFLRIRYKYRQLYTLCDDTFSFYAFYADALSVLIHHD